MGILKKKSDDAPNTTFRVSTVSTTTADWLANTSVIPNHTGARYLDVPIAKVVKAAEDKVLAEGHEVNGFLSFSNGFLPMLYPERELPIKWRAWNDLARNVPDMVSNLTLRKFIETKMPTLSVTGLHPRYYYRAALILGMSYMPTGTVAPTNPRNFLTV
mmetsp:Transcript_36870/g.89547  ORF Transcript_36870/g.89547 Transcript_36870/m.89547 type:complete len:159 (-) Transcript_36870:3090-3566(-)